MFSKQGKLIIYSCPEIVSAIEEKKLIKRKPPKPSITFNGLIKFQLVLAKMRGIPAVFNREKNTKQMNDCILPNRDRIEMPENNFFLILYCEIENCVYFVVSNSQ